MAKTQVAWRERALEDISRLHDFLYDKDHEAASRAAQVLRQGGSLLETSPRLGRPMADGTRRRELFMPFGTSFYVLRYFLHDNTVIVIRVWHSKENRIN
jgi:toxin ParE1/3/4